MCNVIKASKLWPDETCVFRVYDVNGKLTIKTYNGLFMGREDGYFIKATRVLPELHSSFSIEAPEIESNTPIPSPTETSTSTASPTVSPSYDLG